MAEEYRPVQRGKGVPVLEVEVVGPEAARTSAWLELGKARSVSTPAGPLILTFGSRDAAPKGHP
jgi:hypothetical protein